MLLVARRLKNSGYEIDEEETEHRHASKEGFVMISRKKIAAPGAKNPNGRHDSRSESRLEWCLKMTADPP